ncbi:charged multivesicular body protein 2a isoform X2 [Lontra canadensis]|uniref:charged multivesicular body protein 2a isoform X2 n=1 Tax=Lontra canadensis TaxID=76717 RepID=UPI0013F37EE6|nr:charged multivesicular body protein 2a isoform X2 [Lontra canadensis]
MDLLFGRRKTPEELLRQNQRALNRAMRELDRERQKLETQEKKIIADIKKMAKQGQMDAVRIMAKDLVRTRRYVRKFVLMRANIQAVSLKIQTLKSNNSMAQAMKGVTKAMGTMNRQLKLPQIQKIMMEFERQAEIMDMKEEMMNDAIDDAMGDEEDEEERLGGTPGALLTPTLCRPPLHRRLTQCGCQWEESRGRSLSPSRCRCRPGRAAQEPAEGLITLYQPRVGGGQWMPNSFIVLL